MLDCIYRVARIGIAHGNICTIYDNIPTIVEANVLAQYELSTNSSEESFICVIPNNMHIENNENAIITAKALAKKYRV